MHSGIKQKPKIPPTESQEEKSFLEEIPETGMLLILDNLDEKDRAHLSQVSKTMHSKVRSAQPFLEKPVVIGLQKITREQLQNMNASYRYLEIRNLDTVDQLNLIIQKFPNLQKLVIHSGNINNLTLLQELKNLTHLELGYMYEVTDLTPLQGLTNLTHLELLNLNVADLTPLQGLTNLSHLELNELPNVTDFTPLQGLTKLTHLALWGLNFADLALLQGLTNLKELSLCCLSKVITDLTPLQERLTNLTRLGLWGLNVTDFTFLRGLTNLKELFWGLDADLTLLQGLTNLTYLGLNHLNVTDLTPLLKLPLKELSLAELGSKGVSRQILLKMPFLKEVRFYYLDKERKQELKELLKQKPSFKIFYDDRLLNPQESSWEDFD
jgi:Leucine-rich repeat (LRR) protein